MDIAIIGAGNVGRALATSFTRAGHSVVITSHDPEDAEPSRPPRVPGSPRRTPKPPRVPRSSSSRRRSPAPRRIAAEVTNETRGKIVVDATNRMSYGAAGPEIDTSTSNAEELAVLLPEARVVKAFNTLFASNQSDPVSDGVQLDGFVAGDDADAKGTVLALVESIGLHPVDVGPLARSRQLEGMAFLNIAVNIAEGGAWTSGWKLVGAPAKVAVAA